MKILVTGGYGFIGSNFILNQVLIQKNEILNLDKLTYSGNKKNLNNLENNRLYNFIHADICDREKIIDSLNQFNPQVLVHFAAESHVDRSIDDPMIFAKTNILGTATLLRASTSYWKQLNNKNFRFIHISTDEVFGSLEKKGLFNEKSPYSPSSPYSASKASADHLVRAWHKTYGLPSIITNCSNNYGPYQFPEKLMPLIITNCIDEKPLPIYGNGSNIRDWLFVEDHCKAINKIIQTGRIGDTYCIGGNCEMKNIDVVKKICLILDQLSPRKNGKLYGELITYVKDRPGHDFRYAIDSTKIFNDLGWKQKETFDTGIRKTIEWYLDNEDWWRKLQNCSQEKSD